MIECNDCKCKYTGICGGCFYQQETPEQELELKCEHVRKLLEESYTEAFEFEGILQSPVVAGYRNKMEYSFGDDRKDGPLTLGLHQKRSFYNVLDITDCKIVNDDFNRIVEAAAQYFRELGLTYMNKRSHLGYLRYLIVRRATHTGEILVDLVTSTQAPAEEEQILAEFARRIVNLENCGKLEGHINGVLHTKNDTLSDAVRDDGTEILFGTDHISETLLGLRFNISPFSFFQTSSLGAELLYSKVREYISGALKSDRTVYDLYSGTGTIAQIVAPAVKKVVGVEIIEEAVEAAKQNAEFNGLKNCEFIAGDVLNELDHIQDKPDVIILDPPRDGVNPKALKKIIEYGVDTIVYISCKPESLARDLVTFRVSGYRMEKCVCVNQFPRTKHVETVALLKKATV